MKKKTSVSQSIASGWISETVTMLAAQIVQSTAEATVRLEPHLRNTNTVDRNPNTRPRNAIAVTA